MHEILTGFETKIQQLIVAFRFVVFTLMTVGLVVHLSHHHYHMESLVRPLGRALTITALIASMGWWFPLIERTLLATAEFIDADYAQNPSRAADTIREGSTPNPDGKSNWSWRKLNESLYHAVTDAISWVFITVSTLLTGPMLIMQYVLRWILYLLTPFALATLMIPALQGLGVRFFQQVLAVLSWPIGFALTNLIALSIWQDFRNSAGPEPATVELALLSPSITNLGGLLAGIALLVGTIATPIVCQQLFASGYAFTGNAGSPVTIARTMSEVHSRLSSLLASHSSGSGGGNGAGVSGGVGAASGSQNSGGPFGGYGAAGVSGSFAGSSYGTPGSFGTYGGQGSAVASPPPPPPPPLPLSAPSSSQTEPPLGI